MNVTWYTMLLPGYYNGLLLYKKAILWCIHVIVYMKPGCDTINHIMYICFSMHYLEYHMVPWLLVVF